MYLLEQSSPGYGKLRLDTITGPVGSEVLTIGAAYPTGPSPGPARRAIGEAAVFGDRPIGVGREDTDRARVAQIDIGLSARQRRPGELNNQQQHRARRQHGDPRLRPMIVTSFSCSASVVKDRNATKISHM